MIKYQSSRLSVAYSSAKLSDRRLAELHGASYDERRTGSKNAEKGPNAIEQKFINELKQKK